MANVMINGAGGRIGRGVTFEAFRGHDSLDNVVLLNEPAGIDWAVDQYKKDDPVHGGPYAWTVEKSSSNELLIDGVRVHFTAEKDLSKIPFRAYDVDLVLECSGAFSDSKGKDPTAPPVTVNPANAFLQYGVKTVIQTYPTKLADATLIMGVNHANYQSDMKTISNASCTTKALAMPLAVLRDNGVEVYALSMDTTHAETGKELSRLASLTNKSDLEKITREDLNKIFRMATHSTGAAKATALVFPELKGRMAGMSYRVPTLDGSFANMYMVIGTNQHFLTNDDVNSMFLEAVNLPKYANRLGIITSEDAQTSDIVGMRQNGTVVTSKTVLQKLPFEHPNKRHAYLLTVVSGYDNELGSAVDPVMLAKYISERNSY